MALEKSPNSKPRGLYDPLNPKGPNYVPADVQKRLNAEIEMSMALELVLKAMREKKAAQQGADTSQTFGLGITAEALGAIVEHWDPTDPTGTREVVPDPPSQPGLTSDDMPEAPHLGELDPRLSLARRVMIIRSRDAPGHMF